jgi:hypothetical protein
MTDLQMFCKFVRKLEFLIVHCHFCYVARESDAFIEIEVIELTILHLITASS